jgi:hypothetical protein
MDCGPAALLAIAAGFGLDCDQGALRAACQVGRDGTSIDTLEAVAVEMGLDAEQIVVPVDHLMERAACCLPAILVVVRSGGTTHFVVAWHRHGSFVQVMDPAAGRGWLAARGLLAQTYRHGLRMPAGAWREWAGSPAFLGPLGTQLRSLGLTRAQATSQLATAQDDPGWRSLAALDASARWVRSLAGAGSVRRGGEARRLLGAVWERSQDDRGGRGAAPPDSWTVSAAPGGAGPEAELVFTCAVLLRVRGRRPVTGCRERAWA